MFSIKKCLLVVLLLTTLVLPAKKVRLGEYRGVLSLDTVNRIELPFNFRMEKKGRTLMMIIYNADERIVADELRLVKDSLFIRLPSFDTEFRCKLTERGFDGEWVNHYRSSQNHILFKAIYGQNFRFEPMSDLPITNTLPQKWEVTFSPRTADSSKAIGLFNHVENTAQLRATFLTETGDYRFLDGEYRNGRIRLSAFDGSRALLFTGDVTANGIRGHFYSGAHWSEPWIARPNPEFTLRDPEKISVVSDPDKPLHFSFRQLGGGTISLSDERFERKPVIVQIMGSWCPNCMDESRYLQSLYEKYKESGLCIVAIAFEKTSDTTLAAKQVQRMKDRIGIRYPIALSQQTSKQEATRLMPALSQVSAFPTTVFLNREHRVVRVHTGFSGPATGAEYEIFKQRTENLIKTLIDR